MIQDQYWKVAGSLTEVYASRRNQYVPVSDPEYLGWLLIPDNFLTNIANEVELQDVLLRNASPQALRRSFTPAEVIAALDAIDHAKAAALFSANELAGLTQVMANDPRILTLAAQCDNFRLGVMADPA